jgi:hypothetical protein
MSCEKNARAQQDGKTVLRITDPQACMETRREEESSAEGQDHYYQVIGIYGIQTSCFP